MKYVAKTISIIGSIAIIMGVIYCFGNNSGHSGFNPTWGSFIFVPLIAIGAFCLAYSKLNSLSAWISMVISVSGFGFGLFIQHTGIMQLYEVWLSNGMPDSNPHSTLLLVGYFIGTYLIVAIIYLFFRNSKKKITEPQRSRGRRGPCRP
jgi:hypothetical protein